MVLPSLVLFARAPEPGRVKTRLVPVLGEAGTLRLYEAFLADAGRAYLAPSLWSAVLAAETDPEHPSFVRFFPPPWRRTAQGEGDLGDRLSTAFRDEIARGAPAVLAVGSDHPALSRPRLERLLAGLVPGPRAAVIPAHDGGYCAVGASADAPADVLFRDIPWSSPGVLDATLAAARASGLPVRVLEPSYDVDRPEDLVRLREDLAARDPGAGDFPAATAAALAGLSERMSR